MKSKLIIFLIITMGIFVKSQDCVNLEKKVLLKDSLSLNLTHEMRNLMDGNWKLQKITDNKNNIRTILNEKFNPNMDYMENNYGVFITYKIGKDAYESIMTFPENDEINHYELKVHSLVRD